MNNRVQVRVHSTCLMGMRVMDGVMLVGRPADSELLATALSPDCGELGPSPFMRESAIIVHKLPSAHYLNIIAALFNLYLFIDQFTTMHNFRISNTVLLKTQQKARYECVIT